MESINVRINRSTIDIPTFRRMPAAFQKKRTRLDSTEDEDFRTPKYIFKQLNKVYGPFDLDVCASRQNALCDKFHTKEDDALSIIWDGTVAYCNCPYSRSKQFVKEAVTQFQLNPTLKRVVILIPAYLENRAYHDWVYKYATDVILYKARIAFEGPKVSRNKRTNKLLVASFGSAAVVFDRDRVLAVSQGLNVERLRFRTAYARTGVIQDYIT